jgi:hypothetical protein
MARRFLDEIRMAPGHFWGRIAAAATEAEDRQQSRSVQRLEKRPSLMRS